MALSDAELCKRFERLYPGAVTDSLDDLGCKRQTLPSDINALTHDMQMAGIAFPVLGRPDEDTDYDENIRRFLGMLSEAPEYSVVAYETRDEETAHLGELSTTALKSDGCRGAVIDGGIRDVRFIMEQDFPVFARYRTPVDAPPRWSLEAWNIPITIGDVEIRPGDVLVGDVDGVACVPRQIALDVLERAEDTADIEDEIRKEIRNGVMPLDAFDKYGKF